MGRFSNLLLPHSNHRRVQCSSWHPHTVECKPEIFYSSLVANLFTIRQAQGSQTRDGQLKCNYPL